MNVGRLLVEAVAAYFQGNRKLIQDFGIEFHAEVAALLLELDIPDFDTLKKHSDHKLAGRAFIPAEGEPETVVLFCTQCNQPVLTVSRPSVQLVVTEAMQTMLEEQRQQRSIALGHRAQCVKESMEWHCALGCPKAVEKAPVVAEETDARSRVAQQLREALEDLGFVSDEAQEKLDEAMEIVLADPRTEDDHDFLKVHGDALSSWTYYSEGEFVEHLTRVVQLIGTSTYEVLTEGGKNYIRRLN
jgi:hypothetical protein